MRIAPPNVDVDNTSHERLHPRQECSRSLRRRVFLVLSSSWCAVSGVIRKPIRGMKSIDAGVLDGVSTGVHASSEDARPAQKPGGCCNTPAADALMLAHPATELPVSPRHRAPRQLKCTQSRPHAPAYGRVPSCPTTKKRQMNLICGAGVLLTLVSTLNCQAAERPNIVLLLIDDWAWNGSPMTMSGNCG